MPSRCRSCKAPIRWAVNADTGRRMPFDPDPSDAGEWRLASSPRGQPPRAVYVSEGRRVALAGELLVTHWATCPNASQHRRRTR